MIPLLIYNHWSTIKVSSSRIRLSQITIGRINLRKRMEESIIWIENLKK